MSLSFFVPGIPQPQGSTSSYFKGGRIVTTSANPKLKAWRHAIAMACKAQRFIAFYDKGEPIGMAMTFYFARPANHFNAKGDLKDLAPKYKTTTPDSDKLIRATLDSLTGIAWWGDQQVVDIECSKRYCDEANNRPGVAIVIWHMTDT